MPGQSIFLLLETLATGERLQRSYFFNPRNGKELQGLGIILCFRQRQGITADASHVREVAFGHQPSAIAL